MDAVRFLQVSYGRRGSKGPETGGSVTTKRRSEAKESSKPRLLLEGREEKVYKVIFSDMVYGPFNQKQEAEAFLEWLRQAWSEATDWVLG